MCDIIGLMKHRVELPTDLGYVTLVNHVPNYRTGRVEVIEPPLVPRIDHQGFLEAVLKRINPDGSITTPYHAIFIGKERRDTSSPIKTRCVSDLGLKERIAERNRLAQTLFIHAMMAATVYHYPEDQVAYQETQAALALSPYRHESRFLQEVEWVVITAYSQGRTIEEVSSSF